MSYLNEQSKMATDLRTGRAANVGAPLSTALGGADPEEPFIDTADSRETSKELMEAIYIVAGKNNAEAVRVWEDPTPEELLAIWERVTCNGLRPSTNYFWGESGARWAADSGLEG